MKLFLATVFLGLARLCCAQSSSGSDILQQAIDKLPPCAVSHYMEDNELKADDVCL